MERSVNTLQLCCDNLSCVCRRCDWERVPEILLSFVKHWVLLPAQQLLKLLIHRIRMTAFAQQHISLSLHLPVLLYVLLLLFHLHLPVFLAFHGTPLLLSSQLHLSLKLLVLYLLVLSESLFE